MFSLNLTGLFIYCFYFANGLSMQEAQLQINMIAQQFRTNCDKCDREQQKVLPDLTLSNHSISTCLANGEKLDKCIESRCDILYVKVLAKSLQDSCLTIAGCFKMSLACKSLVQKLQIPPVKCKTLDELKKRCYCSEYQRQHGVVMKLLEESDNCEKDDDYRDLMGSGQDKSGEHSIETSGEFSEERSGDYSGDYSSSGSGSGVDFKGVGLGISPVVNLMVTPAMEDVKDIIAYLKSGQGGLKALSSLQGMSFMFILLKTIVYS